jgi:hypothetical protein
MANSLSETKIKLFSTQTNPNCSKFAFGDDFGGLPEQTAAPDIAVVQPAKYLKTTVFRYSA